jgi:hypothetical protein
MFPEEDRVNIDEATAMSVAQHSSPAVMYMVGRVVQYQEDPEDGSPLGMEPLMIVMIETADDSQVIARFDLPSFRQFVDECQSRLALYDGGGA